MIKNRYSLFGVLLMCAAVLCGCETRDKNNLKLSICVPEESTWYKGAHMFAEIVRQKTNYRVKIRVFPDGILANGNQKKELEMLQSGAIDLTFHSTLLYTIIEPRFTAISMPWIIDDEKMADRIFSSSLGAEMLSWLPAKGIVGLGWGENGFRQITNNIRPIEKPEDLNGLKIRIPGISLYTSIFKNFGANPSVMNWSEVFTSLQQRTIDGQENPVMSVIIPSRLYEVQKFITIWDYSYDALILGINKKLWDSLDKQTRDIMLEAAEEACEYQRMISRRGLSKGMQLLKEKGMETVVLTNGQKKEFRARMDPVYMEFAQQFGSTLLTGIENCREPGKE